MIQRIDIILPTIGRSSLETAVQSVISQEYPHWHLFIIEDGQHSSFESLKDNRIIINTRLGLPYNDSGTWARNFGIASSNAEWIAYIDDDDIWLPNHLSTLVQLSADNQSANMLRTAGRSFFWKHKHPRTSKLVRKLGPINYDDILTVGMAHRRDLFNKTEGWKPGTAHDKDLWNNMLRHGGKPAVSSEITFEFRR